MEATQILTTQTPAPPEVKAEPKVEPKVETKIEPKAEPKSPSSDSFAALAKKEKNLYQKSRELSQQEAQLKADQAKTTAERAHWEKVKKEARINPLAAMKELGLEYKDVTDYILNQEKPSLEAHLQKVQEDLQELRRQQEEGTKKAQEAAEQAAKDQNERVLAQFKQNIAGFVEEKKEEYDLIYHLGAQQMIFDGITKTHEETGRIPTIKEAADGVQAYLIEQVDKILPNLKWFKDKYVLKTAPVQKTPDGAVVPPSTLSNTMGTAVTSLPAATEEERIRRALAALDSTP